MHTLNTSLTLVPIVPPVCLLLLALCPIGTVVCIPCLVLVGNKLVCHFVMLLLA